MVETIGVYPGRFQPFHTGHAEIVNYIIREYQPKKLVVAFPNNTYRTPENPFLGSEVKEIIRLSLSSPQVFPLAIDVGSDLVSSWQKYLRNFTPDYIFSGNQKTLRLIHRLNPRADLVDLTENSLSNIHGSEIRRRLAVNDPSWQTLVSPTAIDYIQKHFQII